MEDLTKSVSPRPANGKYFRKIKLVLRAFGVSLRADDSRAYKIYSLLIFIPFVIMYILLDVLEIFKADKEDANNLIIFFIPFCLGGVKGIYLLRNRIEIGKLLDKLEQEPFTPNRNRGGKLEEELIEKCVWITNLQAYAYWICSAASATTDSIITISKRFRSSDYHDWEFTYGKFAVLNVTYSPNYEICWAYQTLSTIPIAGFYMLADLIIAACLAHISFHFQILQHYIKQIPSIGYEKMVKENECNSSSVVSIENGPVTPWRNLKETLVHAVNYHVAIIGIAKEVEDLFKDMLLIIFLTTMGTLCFSLYHASKIAITDPHMLGAAGIVLTCYVQVLLLCFWGEQVTFHSQEVGRAAFETDYVATDTRFQKALALIIRRSQKPTSVTASNFTVIGFPTCLWIIRTSYSAFMMLRKLQN